jgi:HEAT repeat protein/energy-coupling factor transporter ATP-binding protein EcfA2
MEPAPELVPLEERYHRLVVDLFARLQLKGISAAGKALSLPLEDIYVELKAVSEVPEAADTFSADERRMLQEAEGRGRHHDADLRMHLDSLRFERWRREARGGQARSQRQSIEAWIADPGSPGLVILGDPGSGKSTLLHYLALRAVRELLDAAPGSGAVLRSAKGEPWLPIFVPLAAYDDWLRRSGMALSLGEFLPIYYEIWHDERNLGPLFRKAFDDGRALVLLDGLDEVLDVATRQHIANQARALIQMETGRGNRFVVTSRVVGYREAPLPGDLPHVTVLDFGPDEIATFARKWCVASEVWARGELTEVAQRSAAAEEQALLEDVRANPSVLRLAANPLLLTMLSLLRRQGGKLPDQRVRLYERYVGMLLDNNWENVRSEGARSAEPARFDQDLATDYLIDLALWLQRHKPSGTARRQEIEGALIEISLGLDGLDPKLASAPAGAEAVQRAAEFLRDMRHFAGLLAERGRDAYGFSHLTFQEYFAGRALARMEPDDRWTILEANLHRPRWREPILLCAGQLGIVERRGKAVSDLARRILGANSAHEAILHRDVFLVAGVAADNVGLDRALLDELAGRLKELAEDRVPAVRRTALGGLGHLARLGYEGVVSFWEDRIRTRRRPDETAMALKSVLGAEPCIGLRRALIGWLNDPAPSICEQAMYALKTVVTADDEVKRGLLAKIDDPVLGLQDAAIAALVPLLPIDAEVRRLIIGRLDGQPPLHHTLRALQPMVLKDDDVRRVVVSKLSDPTDPLRSTAIAVLRPLVSSDEVIRALIAGRLNDSDDWVRRAAVYVLGTLVSSNEDIKRLLVGKLDDGQPWVRAAALYALGAVMSEEPSVRRLVIDKLDDADQGVREAAISVLGPLTSMDEEIRRLLLSRLDDKDSSSLHRMIQALEPLVQRDEEVRRLIIGNLDSPNEDARVAAIEALRSLLPSDEEVRRLIIGNLDDPDLDARIAAIEAFRVLIPVDEEARRLIIGKLDSPDRYVLSAAIATLGSLLLRDDEVRHLIIGKLRESGDDDGVRWAAVGVLGSLVMRDEEVRRLVLGRLDDPNGSVRGAAVEALGPLALKDEEVRRLVLDRFNDPDENVQGAAIRVLGSLIPSDAKLRSYVVDKIIDCVDSVSYSAFEALGPMVSSDGQVRDIVFGKLDDPDGWIRVFALDSIKGLVTRDEEVRLRVLERMDDSSFHVRAMAARVLSPLIGADPDVRRRLFPWLGVVTEGTGDDELRRQLADAYAALLEHEPYMLARVKEMLRSPAWPERQGAAWALIAMPGGPPPDTMPALRGLLDDQRGEESWPERLEAVASLLNDRDANISRFAIAVAVDALDYARKPWYGIPHSAARVHAKAAAALGRLEPVYRDDAVLARLIRLVIEEADEDVLDAAYQALLRLTEAPDPVLQPTAVIHATPSPLAPLVIEHLTLRDFKNLDELTLDLTHPSALEGRWTCLAGVNGAGKSTILQALALVLLGEDLAHDLGSVPLKRLPRRDGERTTEARIDVTVRQGDKTHHLALIIGENGIDRDRIPPPERDAMRAFWSERAKHHLVVGYGAGRNLSERPFEDDSKNPDVRRQMTLFDPLYPMASTQVLIGANGEHKPISTLLRRLLAVVLEDTGLSVAPDPNALRFVAGNTSVPPADLPDGFRATVAWLADLCAAWYEKAPEEALTGEPGRMRGIVLVDEIDLHLHPRLQRLLVPRLRKALPHVQWIVTTHSPLILSSFDRHEIVALDATKPGKKRVIDRQILGFSTDEVYDWLMDTDPRSAALDDKFANGDPAVGADVSLILAQSPDVSEEDAEANRAWRQKLAAKLKAGPVPGGNGGSHGQERS